ncbi:MAG: preprotein translocase subunit SecG [Bacteroidetes bacterium]|nr:preprotein translocase subunit SecG [Bacteroidota bacterium]
MYVFLTVILILIAVLLGLVVLIQNPKGGGVNSTLGGASQQIFGASRTTDVVEKTTWTLGVLLLVISLFSAAFLPKTGAVTAATPNGKAPAANTATQNESEPEKRAREMGASNPANRVAAPAPQQTPAQPAPAQQPK